MVISKHHECRRGFAMRGIVSSCLEKENNSPFKMCGLLNNSNPTGLHLARFSITRPLTCRRNCGLVIVCCGWSEFASCDLLRNRPQIVNKVHSSQETLWHLVTPTQDGLKIIMTSNSFTLEFILSTISWQTVHWVPPASSLLTNAPF